MSKSEYLSALSKALAGLPPETVAKTLAYYEQRFIDGLAVGRSEAEIAQELDEPRKIAMTLRANAHLHAFEEKRSPANLARMAMSFLGLAVFNLFMVVPAVVYTSMLMALYATAFAFYLSGIAITASGLAGANELVLNGPLRHLVIFDDDEDRSMQTRVSIGADGLQVQQEPSPALQAALDGETSRSGRLMEKAEAVAESGVRISTDLDAESRTAQTAIGVSLILGGILLCLLSIVVTRYTVIGIRRYIEMNFSLLRGR
ncbi:DUF1700 domain-containing protein [Massilia sp. BJB1822]|uniref:DUF1700 domain-containing protein n=1 Tax=Massilia sp. BJB1822 TaxID=2744470 RepID=UPI001593873E|nr:DUF1700 domain-containing protein [Massilia sp. BJB1822]NVE01318.1 DUF1700 domain-containing protein [Massilia sp. BJB1822]